MIITRAGMLDLPGIVELEQSGFGADRWSEESWRSELGGGDDRFVIAARTVDGAVLGVATFQAVAQVADLHRVVVHPEARGQGFGRALVTAGCDWAMTTGARRMLLEVATDNVPALGLYRALGFHDVAVRKDYYSTGRDALVMERDLIEVDEWHLAGLL